MNELRRAEVERMRQTYWRPRGISIPLGRTVTPIYAVVCRDCQLDQSGVPGGRCLACDGFLATVLPSIPERSGRGVRG